MGLLRLLSRCSRPPSLSSLRPPSFASTRNYDAPVPPPFDGQRMPTTSSSAAPDPLARPQTAPLRPEAGNHRPRPPFLSRKSRPRVETALLEMREALASRRRRPDNARALQAWRTIVDLNGIDLLTDKELIRVLLVQRKELQLHRWSMPAIAREKNAANVRDTYHLIRSSGRPANPQMLRHVALAYAKAGSVTGVREVAKEAMSDLPGLGLEHSDVLELMAKANSDTPDTQPVFDELDKMLESPVDENRFTLIYGTFTDALFVAATRSDSNAFMEGMRLFEKHRFSQSARIFEARILFLAVVSEDVPAARKLLDEARESNFDIEVAAYNHVLNGMITTGRHDDIPKLLKEMRRLAIEANGSTYQLLLAMYDPDSKHGRANPVEAVKTFNAMRPYGIVPRPSHYVALARAVKHVVAASGSEGLDALLLDNAIALNMELLNGLRDGFASLEEFDLALKVSDIYLKLSRYDRKKLPIIESWALRHLDILVLAGRGSEWRTSLNQFRLHGTTINTEMCDAILAQYKGYRTIQAASAARTLPDSAEATSTAHKPLDETPSAEASTTACEPFDRMRSDEAATTARGLFDRMRSVGARFSVRTLENMLLTAWDPEKDAALNRNALRYLEAYLEILTDPMATGIQDVGPMAKALQVIRGGTTAKELHKPSPTPALDAVNALLADGRAGEWEATFAELLQKGVAPTPETYLALLAYHAAHPCSPETAATARAILAHQIAASAAKSHLIPGTVAFAYVLATLWKNQPGEELSDDAIDVLALFATTHAGKDISKLRPMAGLSATQPLHQALLIVSGDGLSPNRALEMLRSGTKDVNRKPLKLDNASGGSASSAAIPIHEPSSRALEAVQVLIAEGRAAEWEGTLADLEQKAEFPTRGTYRALLAHYAAQPCSPETASAARAILAHQINASTANSSLIPDPTAFANVLATLWKDEPGEALSDEALDVLTLFARTHGNPPELMAKNRPRDANPLFEALSIVAGESRSPKEGLEIMRTGAKDVKRRWTADELKIFALLAEKSVSLETSTALNAVEVLIAADRVKDWDVTLTSRALKGNGMTAGAYRALLAYCAAKPCSPEIAATARAILAHQIDASGKKVGLKPDATAFAYVLATLWKAEPEEALSDEALDVLTLFAKTYESLSEFHFRNRHPATELLIEAFRVVAGPSRLSEIGLMRMRSGTKDVKRKWVPSDPEYSPLVAETTAPARPRPFPRPLTLEPTPALDAVSELVAAGGVDNWEATIADLERQGHSMTPEAYLTLLAAFSARPCSSQTAIAARGILAHQLAASTTNPDLIPGARAFSHVLATMWKNKRSEELSDDALDLLALFARTHPKRNRLYFPEGVRGLQQALRIVSGESRDTQEGMRVMMEMRTKEGIKRKWAKEDLNFFEQIRKQQKKNRRSDATLAASAAGDGVPGRASYGGSNPTNPRTDAESGLGDGDPHSTDPPKPSSVA
ncbi:hypothetical protein BDK51DRAFT_47547 [Blyttiomyces helicus]|uniref:Pentacotripeptide-repeat region of PRORP domain-containing protein n=1 Tax=Blyttiomyces helicus TaxID=388810 RepID=A0A4P9WIF3_9FUNG|nr:hypothetical protein BDK51DRAFT_47547 [Blyttiomyces helicus]|eukprot:RKO91218.1 hypothetical protein BDK51DRAFT_47547 [Blyttiomyces helicus]